MADHLAELLKDTPIGRLKLLAAWDSLSVETQIRLLHEISGRGRTERPSRDVRADRPIWLRALSSPSEYVRYLAAREMRFDDEIESKVASDASPLVRYSQAKGLLFLTELSNENFDRFPREANLAVVSNDDPPKAANLAGWIDHAVKTKSASEDEICDIVLEYFSNPEAVRRLQEYGEDFIDDRERRAGFEALWNLVPKVPERLGHCLVRRLPGSFFGNEPPDEILNWLEASPSYMGTLLDREDVPLVVLRRKIFFSTDPLYNEDTIEVGFLRIVAVSHHFYLDFKEVHSLIRERSKLLRELANSKSLEPVILYALTDYARSGEHDDVDLKEWKFERNFESAMKQLHGEERRKEIRLLKIYRLAKAVMPWRPHLWGDEKAEPELREPNLKELPEPLKFLSTSVAKGDTWGTFIEFANQIATPQFDQLLPLLEDLNLTEESAAGALDQKGIEVASEKRQPVDTNASKAKPAEGSGLLGNTIIALGIVAALLTMLLAVGGIIDNEARNFRSGVIAMAISAGAIVFAGSQLFRHSR